MNHSKNIIPIAVALGVLLVARTTRGEEPQTLPTITVTASPTTDAGYFATHSAAGTKTDTPLIETPQTINVITADEIAARAAQSTSQALAYTPGVNPQAFGTLSNGVDFLFVRGFDAPQYLDGTRLEFVRFGNQVKIEPYGMERIEVLKGPASVLYGQNAPGGLVNFVSKRPTEEPVREIQLLGGSFDRLQGALDFSGPIDPEGRLLYRLIALVRDSDFQVDFGKDDRYFVSPELHLAAQRGHQLHLPEPLSEGRIRERHLRTVPAGGRDLAAEPPTARSRPTAPSASRTTAPVASSSPSAMPSSTASTKPGACARISATPM